MAADGRRDSRAGGLTATRKTSRLAGTLHVERSKQLRSHEEGETFLKCAWRHPSMLHPADSERNEVKRHPLLLCLLESRTEDLCHDGVLYIGIMDQSIFSRICVIMRSCVFYLYIVRAGHAPVHVYVRTQYTSAAPRGR